MTTSVNITLTPHELHLCGSLLGIEHFPVVLGSLPRSPDTDSWNAALTAARAALLRRGLLDASLGVVDELEDFLDALGHPAHDVAARCIDDGGVRRLCVASGRRSSQVSATRGPGKDAVVVLRHSESGAASLRAFLGEHRGLAFEPASARLRELQAGLAGAEGFASCAHALEGAGIVASAAGLIADVMTKATAHTEVVTSFHKLGESSAMDAAMVIYDAPAGRIIATPHRAPDGAVWMTFASGSWDRVARGLISLDELAAVGAAHSRQSLRVLSRTHSA